MALPLCRRRDRDLHHGERPDAGGIRYRSVYASERTPVAKWVSDRVLTLPMFADLALDDVDRICDVVLGCAR